MFNGITWPSCSDHRQYGVFPSAEHLYRAYLRCHGFLNNSPMSQFHHPLLTNQNAMWPNWPTFHQLDPLHTNFTNYSPICPTFHQCFSNLANFSPQLDQPPAKYTKTFHQLHQLFTKITHVSPTFHELHQLVRQLFTNFSPTSPAPGQIHQLHQLYANFTIFSPTWPVHRLFTIFSPTWLLREPLVITDGLTSYNWTHKSAKLLS